MKFSANLGFLWADRPLPDAIRAAARAGFGSVECHWPYDTPAADVGAALRDTGLRMISLNTRPGDRDAGEFGLSALPGREAEAREAVDEALAYAEAVGARAVHVMSGVSASPDAPATLAATLRHACHAAGARTILIEPINRLDVPGYVLGDVDMACTLLHEVGAPNLGLMLDCYHLARMGHDVPATLERLLPLTGHIQIAGHPGRGAPDTGTLDYAQILGALARLGWDSPIGAEYRPGGPTGATLGWMERLRA